MLCGSFDFMYNMCVCVCQFAEISIRNLLILPDYLVCLYFSSKTWNRLDSQNRIKNICLFSYIFLFFVCMSILCNDAIVKLLQSAYRNSIEQKRWIILINKNMKDS